MDIPRYHGGVLCWSKTFDPNPTITSVILTPTLNSPTVNFNIESKKKLVFNLEKNKVIVSGPDPSAFWTEVQNNGGVSVVNDQVLALGSGEDEGGDNKVVFRFKNNGDLKKVKGEYSAVLRCTATDASGNVGTDDASPPHAPGDDDDDDD